MSTNSLPTGARNEEFFPPTNLARLPDRDDWADATEKGRQHLDQAGKSLVESLGYYPEPAKPEGGDTYILVEEPPEAPEFNDAAACIIIDPDEPFDHPQDRFDGLTPTEYALAPKKSGVYGSKHLVIAVAGQRLRMYCRNPEASYGTADPADTFFELDLATLPADHAGYLQLLFAAEALRPGGSCYQILEYGR